MNWKRRAPGATFKNYEREIITAYEQALAKLTVEELLESVDEVFEEYKDQVYIYSRDLIKKLKKAGYLLFAISGSQSEIVERIAGYYDFDAFVGTVYEHKNNQFTGGKTFHAQHKDRVLKKLVKQFGATSKSSFGVGDTASDIAMLELVEQPIAFNPDRDMFKHAKERGWRMVVERKNMVYELEDKSGKYQLVKTNAG